MARGTVSALDATLERGFIVLADLSGFTRYVTETEIRHGAEVVAASLDTVVHQLSPPLDVEEIEGDAVFAVARGRLPMADRASRDPGPPAAEGPGA